MGWYYAAGADSVGPMSLQQLKTVLQRFPNWEEIPVWREGFSGWKNAGDVAELFVGPPPVPRAKIVRREVRKRGFFGRLFLILFFAFNALMLWWFIDATSRISALPPVTSEAGRAGQAIGMVTGYGFLLFVWVCGAVIFGLLALLSRGRKTITEEIERQ
jgi:GYF domain 2